MSHQLTDRSMAESNAALFATTDQTSFLANPQVSDYPESWYLLCDERELRRGPVKKTLLGKDLVVFRTPRGKVVVLDNRCVHMGSELSKGCVIGETIQCSLHNWQFGTDGQCTHIPATGEIPSFAKQTSYPAEIRLGQVFVFNAPKARFPMPFFDDLAPGDLHAAKPFVEYLDCPWYMVGANAVDVQHFAIAHDRRMQELPVVDHPSPFAHRTLCQFTVGGNSLADKLTRTLGGPSVTLKVTDWSSTILFAHSTLERTESFGMLCLVPIHPRRTKVQVTVLARRSQHRIRHVLLDPVRARIRRIAIRKFLRSDIDRLAATTYSPHSLIEVDRQFSEYFAWLGGLIH